MPTPVKSAFRHVLEGTKTQAAIDLVDFPSGRPKMPADLAPLAQEEWKRIVPKLGKRKTLTKADASALEVYCRMYSRWRTVEALAADNPLCTTTWLDKNGNEHEKTAESPASKIASRLEAQLRNFLVQFSATPASRAETKPYIPPAPPPEDFPTRENVPPAESEPEVDLDSAELQKAMAEI